MKGKEELNNNYDNMTNKMLNRCPTYVRDFASDFVNKSPTTKYTYIRDIKVFLEYINNECKIDINEVKNLNNIRKFDINNYISKMNKSDSYKARQTYAIKYFFNFLEENRYIEHDPTIKVSAPKDKKQHEVVSLTIDEVKTIIKSIKKMENEYIITGSHKKLKSLTKEEELRKNMKIERNLSIFMLGITTGLRCSEIISINIEDINFKEKTINLVEKGGYERKVYMSDELINQLKKYLSKRKKYLDGHINDALFINVNRNRCRYGEINGMLNKATSCLNKHITPHKMRSTYATTLYEQTGDIYLVAQGLNHKNIKNTMRYAKPSEEKNRAAADLMGSVFAK